MAVWLRESMMGVYACVRLIRLDRAIDIAI